MGNVSLPHCSGVLTISCVIFLHDLQTEAQKRTTVLAGHEVSLSSTLRIMSKSNSGGKFAHCPCCITSGWGGTSSGAICALVRLRQFLPSPPRFGLILIPFFISLSSRKKLLNDIFVWHINPFCWNSITPHSN